MMTCQTPIACGMISAHRVSSSPADWTTRYVGIRPPVNSIVNRIRRHHDVAADQAYGATAGTRSRPSSRR